MRNLFQKTLLVTWIPVGALWAVRCAPGSPILFPVNNGGDGGSAHFIFANLNGTISAWDKGPTAFSQATTGGAVYTGLAINGTQTRLYAANSTGTGRVDVFDSSFNPVSLGDSAFVNPALSDVLVPFNVREIGGNIYVVYAPAGRPADISAPLGAGAVAIFDEDGNFITQLIAGSRLAAPWGITLAPAGFGRFINHLLVGNFSFLHSDINAFDLTTGKLGGTVRINVGKGNKPGRLWAHDFGVGGANGGDPNTLYLTDGIGTDAGHTGCSPPDPFPSLRASPAGGGVRLVRRPPQPDATLERRAPA